jgi:hypothetical protein
MMWRIHWCLALVCAFAAAQSFAATVLPPRDKHHYVPPCGFIPDETTARAVAEAVLVPIYGKEHIEAQKPLTANLVRGVWHVRGVLPANMLGGVAVVEISKQSGEILRVSHGK